MPPDETPRFDVLLRRYRESAGLTQEELAERANLSVRGISNLERGVRRTPYLDTVRRLADALRLENEDRASFEAASGRLTNFSAATLQADSDPGGAPGNLPEQLSSFVGREQEVAEVRALLTANRLVTLTGAGGSGKTRIALAVGEASTGEYVDGRWIAELAGLTDPSLVLETVAAALGVQDPSEVSLLETLTACLRSKALLLILDNCEQVVGACASLAQALLGGCRHICILATSREPLRVPGEAIWPVSGLSVLPPYKDPRVGAVAESEAARLFLERARSLVPTFALTDENAPAVAQICRRLDGLPLALELAAARVPALSPAEIAARLDDGFRVLGGGSRAAPPRHQTLRATLDWSYDLLSAQEQILYHRLSTFVGGFTIQAAEAVGQGGAVTRDEVLDAISGLVDRSIVVADGSHVGTRYRLLEPVRQYGWERLLQTSEGDSARERHALHYLGLAEYAASKLTGPQQAAWLQRVEREHDNLRLALRWLFERGDIVRAVRLTEALRRFWYARGHLGEARRWVTDILEEARAVGAEKPALARALEIGAELATDQGDYSQAVSLAEESLPLYRQLKDRRGEAFCLTILGAVAIYQGEYKRAESVYAEALELYRELDDWWGVGLVLNNCGLLAREQGENERAADLYAESLDIQRRLGDVWTVALVLDNLAEVMRDQGERDEAVGLYEEALRLRRELGDVRGIADTLSALGSVALDGRATEPAAELFRDSLGLYRQVGDRWRSAVCLEGLAQVAALEGSQEHAAQLYAAAAHLRRSIGHPVSAVDRSTYDRELEAVRQALGEARFTAAWLKGQARDPEEIAGIVPGRRSLEGEHLSCMDAAGAARK